jgi:hypothetical protein
MKAKICIAAAALAVLVVPVHASTPRDNMFGNPANGPAVQSVPGANAGNIYGDVFRSPFENRAQQDQSDLHSLGSRGGNNLLPPRMDANGVPNPRI